MSAVSDLFGSHEGMRSCALDVVGLLRACVREDGDAITAMLATYQTDQDRAQLACGLLGTAVTLLRCVAGATGTTPEQWLAALAQDVREDQGQ